MGKLIKLLIGVALIPVCVGTASAVGRLLQTTGRDTTLWIPVLAGAAGWLLVYFLFPRPMWLYVAGHELTHAVCALGFGKKVGRLRISSQGGNVEVSDSNFIISLAPYFVPFYAVVLVLAFLVGRFFLSWDQLELPFLTLLGAAYAFHVTLTTHVLKTRQTDVTNHGYLFSAVMIFIGNALVLVAGIPLLAAQPKLTTALRWCWEDTLQLIQSVQTWVA